MIVERKPKETNKNRNDNAVSGSNKANSETRIINQSINQRLEENRRDI